MNRRNLARNSLLSFAAQPWTLFEEDPNAGTGGAGGGGTTVGPNGFPESTPVADMPAEQQAAYWKHQSRKHEARATAAPDAAELERLRAAEAELTTRKSAELTETQRLQAEADAAKATAAAASATAAAATAELLRIKVASEKGLTAAHAEFLKGSTREELETAADALKALVGIGGNGNGGSGAERSGGPRGGDVNSGPTTTATGAELYKQRHGKN